jgi:flavodoxin
VNALIVVDSEFGNTARVAESVAQGLAPMGASIVRLGVGDRRVPDRAAGFDLLVVAGPTMNRGLSPRLRDAIPAIAQLARDVRCAAFDTRLRAPELFTGSAAKELTKHLRKAGAQLIAPPESFLVQRPAGRPMSAVTIEDGELARARDWGRSLADLAAGTRAA